MQKIETRTGIAVIIGATLVALTLIFTFWNQIDDLNTTGSILRKKPAKESKQQSSSSLVPFNSEAEFKQYLEDGRNSSQSMGGGMGGAENMALMEFADTSSARERVTWSTDPQTASSAKPKRFSETNKQVLSVDEPDIVKTDGKNIYYSKERNYFFYDERPIMMDKMGTDAGFVPPYPGKPQPTDETQIIRAFPVSEAKKIGKIDERGDLFLSGKTLVILAKEKQKIYAYDVSNPEQPKEKWNWSLDEQSQIVASRMMDGKIFIVSKLYNNIENPCPIRPMTRSGVAVEIACNSIYHPMEVIPTDTTYSFVSLNIETGESVNKTALVGSEQGSMVYMSENSIYLTYQKPTDTVEIFNDFMKENPNLFTANIAERVKKLSGYDISSSAKLEEINSLIGGYLRGLSRDEQTKLRNNVNNSLSEFAKKAGRSYQTTGIVKMGTSNLELKANGEVPGSPLNQFSLDEYKNNLRIATTFQPLSWLPGGFYSNNRAEQASDVYVLNENLNEVGAVKDLGKGERIYSVRFLQDRGYVVTFKQIDPFFVLDLSSPTKPELKGELKIPGYSSYLHPLPNGQILGIGEEDGQVKLSTFDVSDPSSPKEVSTYRMEEAWSEVGSNHHAFLLDEKHKVFFIPAGEGGYIFSYEGGVRLERAVSGFQVKRAVYIDDYLYVIGEEKIKIINENSWDDEKEIEL